MPATTPEEKAEYTTMAIEPRSTTLVALFAAKFLIHGRRTWPRMNGASSCKAISPKTEASMWIPTVEFINSMTSTGVASTATRIEAEAATIAPPTMHRQIEEKTTKDCTVDGTSVRNKMPRYMLSEMTRISGLSASPMMG